MLYDGVCALCNASVRFVLRWDRRAAFRFAPLQGSLGNRVQDSASLRTVYVLADFGTLAERPLTKARAVLFVLSELGWPWKAASLAGVLPISWLDRLYDFVAGHRYQVFGQYDVCPLPNPEHRDRFIDAGGSPEGRAS